MVVEHLIKSKVDKSPDEVISDTTMMFMACACYVLHNRNKFGKQRIMQFMADVEQIGRENGYDELREYLDRELKLPFPEIETEP